MKQIDYREREILNLMSSPEAFNSYQKHGDHLAGQTFYEYVKMVVTEYRKIMVSVYA